VAVIDVSSTPLNSRFVGAPGTSGYVGKLAVTAAEEPAPFTTYTSNVYVVAGVRPATT
jgi:hypothetical protein